MTDKYILEQERTMPVPITDFPWQDYEKPWEWTAETKALFDYCADRGRRKNQLISMPGFTRGMDTGRYWRAAAHALNFVVATSAPCDGHILRGRVLEVVERAFPGQDAFHGEVMGRFNEAAHCVMRKERYQ